MLTQGLSECSWVGCWVPGFPGWSPKSSVPGDESGTAGSSLTLGEAEGCRETQLCIYPGGSGLLCPRAWQELSYGM